MKPWEYYQTVSVPYPSKGEHTDVYVILKKKVLWEGKGDTEGLNKTLDDLKKAHPEATVVKEFNKETYFESQKAYNKESGKLLDEFRKDLFEEFGVTDHPKVDRVYQIAWEKGHAHGLSEVYIEFSDIVELIKD